MALDIRLSRFHPNKSLFEEGFLLGEAAVHGGDLFVDAFGLFGDAGRLSRQSASRAGDLGDERIQAFAESVAGVAKKGSDIVSVIAEGGVEFSRVLDFED